MPYQGMTLMKFVCSRRNSFLEVEKENICVEKEYIFAVPVEMTENDPSPPPPTLVADSG